jgi:hypothetical protein
VNGVNTGSNSNIFTTSNLQNNSQVKVILTSNAGCITTNTATSNTLVITVNQPINPAITISGNTTINLGQSSLITAAVVNAGASPSYQWQDSTATHNWLTINGAGNSSLNYAAVNTGNKLRCIVTNNTTCSAIASAISNVLTFTVNGGFAGSGATLRLFPNPATSSFTIDTLRLSNLWSSIEITAVDGKLVIGRMSIANKISVTIDVSGLIKGLYFAVLRKEDGERVYIKFIKQ